MKNIADELLNATKAIGKSWDADVRRAENNRGCSALAKQPLRSRSQRHQVRISKEVSTHILKSVKVCADSCITVSFNKEVKKIKKLMDVYATEARSLARSVVRCSNVNTTNHNGNSGTRTDTRLTDIINGITNLNSNCRVCKIEQLSE